MSKAFYFGAVLFTGLLIFQTAERPHLKYTRSWVLNWTWNFDLEVYLVHISPNFNLVIEPLYLG